MKKYATALAIVALVFYGFMGGKAAGHENVKPVRGEIVKIDQPGNMLIVRTGKEEVTLYLVPDTAVRSGKVIKLAYEKDAFDAFKVGDRVGVTYITDAQGKKVAHSILKLKPARTKGGPRRGSTEKK